MCVCVCVFVPSIMATVPLIKIKVRLVLHFAACRGLHLFSVLFCPTRTNRGHKGGGEYEVFFLLSIFHLCPTVPPAVRAFICIARRVRPSLSLVNNIVKVCLLTKLFSYISLSTARDESEKKKLGLSSKYLIRRVPRNRGFSDFCLCDSLIRGFKPGLKIQFK